MTNRKNSMVPAVATLVAVLMTGATAAVMAQNAKPLPDKMTQHKKDLKDMRGMNGTLGGAHYALVMAYRDNLVTFAQALRRDVNRSDSVNVDLARPAVAEMRRSFDQVREHHQAQMKLMRDHADPAMSELMQHMNTHLTTLAEHLTLLESVVNGSRPDAKDVVGHTNEILKECAEMSAMAAKAAPHHAK